MKSEKLTKDQVKARKALDKSYHPLLKQAAKSAGWGYLKPTPFGLVNDWFVDFHPQISTEAFRATLSSTVKPSKIDDLVSRIMGHEGLTGTPLSLLARGPHVLVVPMFNDSIERDGDPELMTDASLAAMAETRIRLETLKLENFIEFVADSPTGNVNVAHVAALILAQRRDEAAMLAERAVAAKQWGGPARVTEDGRLVGFFEMALGYLRHSPT